jgi:heme exporter protein A
MLNTLSATDLHVFRGERHVLRGVSFEARAGEYHEVVGPNGAGKTSLLRTLVGLIHAEFGTVCWNGRSIHDDAQHFHSDLAYLGHDSPLKADLTAAENLWYGAGVRRALSRADVVTSLATVQATAFAAQPVRTLSAGQRRRVALAALLLATVPLWVLDEPATNLDAAGQALVAQLIDAQIQRGGIVIAAVHQALPVAAGRTQRLALAA